MTDNVIWHTDFRARREREAAELEVASADMIEKMTEALIADRLKPSRLCSMKTDTSPSEMNPQDSA